MLDQFKEKRLEADGKKLAPENQDDADKNKQ
jgi:hypothetical protein